LIWGYFNVCPLQLLHHGIQVAHAEIHQPRLFAVPKVLGVFREWLEDRYAAFLFSWKIIIRLWR
jgi:hypothetical protein